MKVRGTTATAAVIAAGIIVAQVILPATLDLIGSIGLLAVGVHVGWKARDAR